VTAPTDEIKKLALRLWRLQREALRSRYVRMGVPVVAWESGTPAGDRSRADRGMATPGATARWVTAAAVGALIAAGLAITVVLLTPSSAWPLVAPVLAAPLLVVGGAMLRRPEVGVVAVMLIAFEYGISLVHRAEGVDSAAPLIGLGLLAMAELAHVARALEAGANEYIMKPFTSVMIREKLEMLGILAA